MSQSLSNIQQIEFDTFVKADYQSAGVIPKTAVQSRLNVVGRFEEFRKMGKVVANKIAYQDAVTPQDPQFDKVRAEIEKYTCATATDKIQDLTVNIDTKRDLARVVGMAMGRRQDQIIIDSMVGNAGLVIPAGGTNFDFAKVRAVNARFNALAVPPEMRHIIISAEAESALLNVEQFTNNFFTNVGVGPGRITSGTLNGSFTMGLNWHVIPEMPDEGGLPKTGNIRSCFAWHQWSVGLGVGQDMRTEVNYEFQKTTWLINGIFSMGGINIDNNGIIEIQVDETA